MNSKQRNRTCQKTYDKRHKKQSKPRPRAVYVLYLTQGGTHEQIHGQPDRHQPLRQATPHGAHKYRIRLL